MRFNHSTRDDGPGWILAVLVLGAVVIRTGQLLAAGDYATLAGYAGLGALLFVLIIISSVYMRGAKP